MKRLTVLTIAMFAAGFANAQSTTPAATNPLTKLIGVWEGDSGVDVAPAQKSTGLTPGAAATSPYFERIVITEGAGATNASEQDLVTVRYHQEVFRKSDKKQFHDQVGYWIWDAKNNKIFDSFCIPRAVCVTAEGKTTGDNEISVGTKGPFADTAFMKSHAKTQDVSVKLVFNPDGTLTYTEKTAVHIYGKDFLHVDTNTLKKTAQNESGS